MGRFFHFWGRYIVCFSVASLASAVSLFVKIKLYAEQFRQRRHDAEPMWVQMLAGLSSRQQKIVEMNTKLQEVKQVCLSHLSHSWFCVPGGIMVLITNFTHF